MPQLNKLTKLNTSVRHFSDGFSVVLYNTEVIRKDGSIISLDTGGWFTPTTRTRINQALNQFVNNGVDQDYQVSFKDSNIVIKNHGVEFLRTRESRISFQLQN